MAYPRKFFPHEDLCTNIQKGFTHNFSKLETTQISKRKDNLILVHLYSRTESNTKEWIYNKIDISDSLLRKRSWMQKKTFWMIPFISSFRTCKTNPRWKYQKRVILVGGEGLERSTRELSGKMDCGSGSWPCITVFLLTELPTLKRWAYFL